MLSEERANPLTRRACWSDACCNSFVTSYCKWLVISPSNQNLPLAAFLMSVFPSNRKNCPRKREDSHIERQLSGDTDSVTQARHKDVPFLTQVLISAGL